MTSSQRARAVAAPLYFASAHPPPPSPRRRAMSIRAKAPKERALPSRKPPLAARGGGAPAGGVHAQGVRRSAAALVRRAGRRERPPDGRRGAVAGLDSWAFSGAASIGQLSFDGGLTITSTRCSLMGNPTSSVRVTPANSTSWCRSPGGEHGELAAVAEAAGTAESRPAGGDITLAYAFELSEATRRWSGTSRPQRQRSTLDLVFYAYVDLDLEGSFATTSRPADRPASTSRTPAPAST